MACPKCEEFQASKKTSFIRWGNANVEVRACIDHLQEIYDLIRASKTDGSIIHNNPLVDSIHRYKSPKA